MVAKKVIKNRVARPSIYKEPDIDKLYLKIVNSEGFQLLYEFVFGSKRNEVPVLLEGFKKIFQQSKSKEEREAIIAWGQILERSVILSLKDKFSRFKRKTGKSFKQEFDKAISGNDTSLFSIVSFDKLYMFEEWARNRISRAQIEGDEKFFYCLGEAIKSKAFKIDGSRGLNSKKTENFRKLIRVLQMAGIDFNRENETKKVFDLIENQINNAEANLPLFQHQGGLNRALKTMGALKQDSVLK